MNVYLYQGKNRFAATKSIIIANKPVSLNTEYMIKFETGMLLVAYPNEDADTDFEF